MVAAVATNESRSDRQSVVVVVEVVVVVVVVIDGVVVVVERHHVDIEQIAGCLLKVMLMMLVTTKGALEKVAHAADAVGLGRCARRHVGHFDANAVTEEVVGGEQMRAHHDVVQVAAQRVVVEAASARVHVQRQPQLTMSGKQGRHGCGARRSWPLGRTIRV